MCVGSLDHLDNCKSFGVFNIWCKRNGVNPIKRILYVDEQQIWTNVNF